MTAAAGNEGATELAFPARFKQVVAVESINGNCTLSGFSNRWAVDEDGQAHQRVFVLPGGDGPVAGIATESMGRTSLGNDVAGTSQATAYASAIIAHVWDMHASLTADQLVDLLAKNADQRIPNYSQVNHGNGLMRVI